MAHSSVYIRQAELDKLVDSIQGLSQRPQLYEISGLPGVGKASFAHRLAQELDRQCNVSTIRLRERASYNVVLAELCDILNIDHLGGQGTVTWHGQLLQELCHLTTQDRLHIVVCGMHRILKGEEAKILRLLEDVVEASPYVTVFMTTRVLCNFPRLAHKFYQYILQPLTLDQAKKYLQLFVDADFYWTYVLNDVIKRCGGHPKLLAKVGHLLTGNENPSAIRKVVAENPFLLLPEDKNLSCGFHDLLSSSKSQSAQRNLCKVLPIEGSFGMPAYTAITGKYKSTALAKFDVRQECSRHTLSTVDRGQSLVMNDLVKFVLHQKCGQMLQDVQSRNNFVSFYGKLLQKLTSQIQSHHQSYLPAFLSELGNMQTLLTKATHSMEEDYDLFMSIGDASRYLIFGYLQKIEVVTFYECCVASARRKDDSRYLAKMLVALAQAIMQLSDSFDIVEQYLQEAQDLYDRLGEQGSLDSVRLLMARGWYHYKRGLHQQAIKHYRSSRCMLLQLMAPTGEDQPLFTSQVTPSHTDLQHILSQAQTSNKAGVYMVVWSSINSDIATNLVCLGDFDAAIAFHKETLQLQHAMWGERHTHTAMTNHKLALAYHLAGDDEHAFRYAIRGLDLKKFLISGPAVTVVHSLSMAAMATLKYNGNTDLSLKMLHEAMEMRRELGAKHPDTGLVYESLGTVYRHRGDHQLACEHYRQASEVWKEMYGGIGPNCCTGEALDLLGDEYLELRRLDDALKTQKECLKMRLEYLSKNSQGIVDPSKHSVELQHVDTACTKIWKVYEAMGDEKRSSFWKDVCTRGICAIPSSFFPHSQGDVESSNG